MFKLAEQYGPLVGRIFLAAIFLIAGFNKLTGLEGTAGYIASKGLPMASMLAALSMIIELGGGILLVIGWHARWAALAIFLFIIPVVIFFHPVWAVPAELWSFWKNIGLMGGMLYVMAYGPGPFSVDERRR